jgi:Leucine Rich repeat
MQICHFLCADADVGAWAEPLCQALFPAPSEAAEDSQEDGNASAAELLADTRADELEALLHSHSPLYDGTPLTHVLAQLPEIAHLPALRARYAGLPGAQPLRRVCELHMSCLAGCLRAAELLSSVPQATHVKIHVPQRMSTQRRASGVAALAASLVGAALQVTDLQVRSGVACNVKRAIADKPVTNSERSRQVLEHLWPLLSQMRALTRLDLSHCALDDAAAANLARWAATARPPLRALDVSWNRISAAGLGALAAPLTALPTMQRLSVSSNRVGDNDFEEMRPGAGPGGLTSVTRLDVANNVQRGGRGMSVLAPGLRCMTQLRCLDISGLEIRHFHILPRDLTTLTCLTHLSVVPAVLSPVSEPLETFHAAHTALAEALPALAALQSLELGGMRLGATGAAALDPPLAKLTQLTHLGLRGMHLDCSQEQGPQQQEIAHVAAAIMPLAALASLDLRDSCVEARNVPALAAALQVTTQLRSVLLDVCTLDVAGACALCSALAASTGLTQLAFSATVQAEAVAVAAQVPAQCSMLAHLRWELCIQEQVQHKHCADLQRLQRLTYISLSGMSKCMAPQAVHQMLLTALLPLTPRAPQPVGVARSSWPQQRQRVRSRGPVAVRVRARAAQTPGPKLCTRSWPTRRRAAARVGAAHSAAAPAAPGAGQQSARRR